MIDADSLNRLGADLWLRGDAEGARLHYLAALKVDSGFYPALANLAVVLMNQNQLTSAVSILRRLVAFAPQNGSQWNNLGNCLTRLERFAEAETAMVQATQLCPDDPNTWHNFSLLLHRLGRSDKALEALNRVVLLGSLTHQVENDIAHILLAKGSDLPAALEAYESRWWLMPHLQPWDFHLREWQGEDLHGKTILLHGEQGFGDTIMTSRFAKDLVARGAKVILGLPQALCRLYEQQDWSYTGVVDIGILDQDIARSFDFHSPMYSAMRWLGIEYDQINPSPYLIAPDIVGPRVHSGSTNVGICWGSGKRGDEMDWRRRYAPLEFWLPLSEIPGVQLWSLQKDAAGADIQNIGADGLIEDCTNTFNDWADTTAFISQLNLVISVDTAVAHLAAALGKPTWMLSQFSNCWRWWDIAEGTGKPWYETMNIYQQKKPGDWERLLQECKLDLENSLEVTNRAVAA